MPDFGHAAVDQARDIRMIERGQHAPLAQEQALFEFGKQSAPQDFHRDLLLEIAADALAEKHRGHAALAEQPHDAEHADLPADHAFGFDLFRIHALGVFDDRLVEEAARVVFGEQAQQGFALRRIGNVRREPRFAVERIHLAQHVERFTQPRADVAGGIAIGHQRN